METIPLNRSTVKNNVAKKSIGCYRLGDPDHEGNFVVGYIGRSTRCLNKRLLDHASDRKYSMFQFLPLSSVRETFDTECRWFHLFRDKSQANLKHPDSPRMLNYKCKYCYRHPNMAMEEEKRLRGDA